MEVFVSLWANAGWQEMVKPGAEHTVVFHCWNSVGGGDLELPSSYREL